MATEAYFDAETVWVSEIDKYASQVIEQRFGVVNHGDLKTINWAEVANSFFDIWPDMSFII